MKYLIGVNFKNNSLENIYFEIQNLGSNGYGSVTFNGISIIATDSIFENNRNLQGSAIFIGGSTTLHSTEVMIQNCFFDSNMGVNGGAIGMGSVWKVFAIISNITCTNNNAYGSILFKID